MQRTARTAAPGARIPAHGSAQLRHQHVFTSCFSPVGYIFRRTSVRSAPADDDAHTELSNTLDIVATEETTKTTQTTKKEEPKATNKDDIFETKALIEELQDRKQFGNRGEAWFIAQVAVLLLILVPPLPLRGLIDLAGTLAITAGVVFIIYGVFSLGKMLSPLPAPRKSHRLIVSGMYSYVRHPMYGGLIMACLGLAAISRNECRVALSFLLWWVLENKVTFEEKALGEAYPEYEAYKNKVKKFFPYIY